MGEAINWDANKLSDLNQKNIMEISALFDEFLSLDDCAKRLAEADAIKSAFYKRLAAEKSAADGKQEVLDGLNAAEEGFKASFANFKEARSAYNEKIEKKKNNNFEIKKQIIADLEELASKEEDSEKTIPAFRELQDRWRNAGPVPETVYRKLNNKYQELVEMFYDKLEINVEQRDLDFKNNLDAKLDLCQKAEQLKDAEDVVKAHAELQDLHKQWRELGPVAQSDRKVIWDRFKDATYVINCKHQEHFENLKKQEEENLEKKTAICEKIEAFASKEFASSNEWNKISKEIQNMQEDWRKIGFAPRKQNKAIYVRYREACDKFFDRKKLFFNDLKKELEANIDVKKDIIKRAAELSKSTEWKAVTDKMIALQREWKESGNVPRNVSQKLWEEFRSHCDAFFNAKNEHFKSLHKTGADRRGSNGGRAGGNRSNGGRAAGRNGGRSNGGNFNLRRNYNKLKQEIEQYEHNLGFFADSKGARALADQLRERIEKAKLELSKLEQQIKDSE